MPDFGSSETPRRGKPRSRVTQTLEAVRLREWDVAANAVKPWISWLIAGLLALDLVGYAMAGALSHTLGLDSTVTSYPLRGAVAGLSIVAILMTVLKGEFKAPLIFVLFLVLYLVRMIWDNSLAFIPDSGKALSVYLGAVMLPALALTSGRIHFDERRTTLAISMLGTLSCLMILYAVRSSALPSEMGCGRVAISCTASSVMSLP